jgi:hypothetical protein
LFENVILAGILFLDWFPVLWQEFCKFPVRMRIDPAKDIFEVFEGINFVGFASGNQPCSLTSALAADE